MKKTIFLCLLLAIVSIMATGCSSCQSDNKKQGTTIKPTVSIVVENTISTDKEYMFVNYGKEYAWYETCVLLKDYLDAEACNGSISGVSNVFQGITNGDPNVVLFAHIPDSTQIDVRHGFWVEDFPMNNDIIKLTYKQAFEKIMATNSPKPHSKQCVLRKPIGPKPCNPQWIFGNIHQQLWVDAVTGEVTDSNPAF